MKASPPGGAKTWLALLPELFHRNPEVVVVRVPNTAAMSIHETLDGRYRFGLYEHNGRKRGLQIIEPKIALWNEHRVIMKEYGLDLADPVYVGSLGDMPDGLLHSLDFVPLIFFKDVMWRPVFNVKRFFHEMREEDEHVH